MDASQNPGPASSGRDCDRAPTSQSIDWYAEGHARDVEVAGVRVTVRFVGRKGRRARIAITGPAGAVFRALDSSETPWSRNRPT